MLLRKTSCFFAARGGCDGRLDRAHWIPKQAIKRDARAADPWDPRAWSPICRKHHSQLDNLMLSVARSELPVSVEEFAVQFGLEHRLDRMYGPKENDEHAA